MKPGLLIMKVGCKTAVKRTSMTSPTVVAQDIGMRDTQMGDMFEGE